MKFVLLCMFYVTSALAYCGNITLPSGNVSMCDTDVDGRNVYLSEGCDDCMARRAYRKSRLLGHGDDDSYHISIAIERCNTVHGTIVFGKESEESRVMPMCHFPKDGSYVYAPHLVP